MKNNDQNVKEAQWHKWLPKLAITLGIVAIFAPFVFTRSAIFFGFDENTGVIGDTIGGITAPFIGMLGAILVYLSFKEQQEANKIQKKEIRDREDKEQNEKIIRFRYFLHLVDGAIKVIEKHLEWHREIKSKVDNDKYTITNSVTIIKTKMQHAREFDFSLLFNTIASLDGDRSSYEIKIENFDIIVGELESSWVVANKYKSFMDDFRSEIKEARKVYFDNRKKYLQFYLRMEKEREFIPGPTNAEEDVELFLALD